MPESQPALLTATEDGTLRVWVEVTLTVSASRNPFETTSPPAALPGLPGGSHFCVTLVIQPPVNLWSGGNLRAAWALPERGLVVSTGPQIRASKVLWITAVATSKGEVVDLATLDCRLLKLSDMVFCSASICVKF